MSRPANKPTPKTTSYPFLISLIFLQTILSTLPGILLYRQQKGENWQGATLLLIYLFVSNFSELGVRMQYKKQQFFPMAAYGAKVLICSVLIVLFASKTQWQFALILFAYELFQTLANSKQFFYLDSFYYTLLNPFFKGFILNLLFLMRAPVFFDKNQVLPLIPAFIATFTLTLFQQGQVSQKKRKKLFLSLFLLSTFLFIFGVTYLYVAKGLFVLWRVILSAACVLGAAFIILQQKNYLKAETTLNIFYVLGYLILYL